MLRMMTVPAELCLLAYLTFTVGLTLGLGPNKDMSFTFLLPAGSTECFFQTTEDNGSMEVSYQVRLDLFLSVSNSAAVTVTV